MTEPSGSPHDNREEGTTPLGSWPAQASAPPFAGPVATPADAPTEPPFAPTLESPTTPAPPVFHDLSGPPRTDGAPFGDPALGGAPGYPPPAYGYGGNPYGPYAYGAWAPPKNNGLAIAALVFGICGFVLCQIFAIPALILGLRARRQIRESQGAEQGDGLALAGVILGGAGIALLVAIIGFYVLIIGVTVASGA